MKRATIAMAKTPKVLPISIHALMKRATVITAKADYIKINFNPRPHEEGDRDILDSGVFPALFQSTPS